MPQAALLFCSEDLWFGIGFVMTVLYICMMALNLSLYLRQVGQTSVSEGKLAGVKNLPARPLFNDSPANPVVSTVPKLSRIIDRIDV